MIAAEDEILTAIGLDRDIAWAAAVDRLQVVPCFDAATGRITAFGG